MGQFLDRNRKCLALGYRLGRQSVCRGGFQSRPADITGRDRLDGSFRPRGADLHHLDRQSVCPDDGVRRDLDFDRRRRLDKSVCANFSLQRRCRKCRHSRRSRRKGHVRHVYRDVHRWRRHMEGSQPHDDQRSSAGGAVERQPVRERRLARQGHDFSRRRNLDCADIRHDGVPQRHRLGWPSVRRCRRYRVPDFAGRGDVDGACLGSSARCCGDRLERARLRRGGRPWRNPFVDRWRQLVTGAGIDESPALGGCGQRLTRRPIRGCRWPGRSALQQRRCLHGYLRECARQAPLASRCGPTAESPGAVRRHRPGRPGHAR